jgi:hypothetical protein
LEKGPVQPDGTGQRQHQNKLGQSRQHGGHGKGSGQRRQGPFVPESLATRSMVHPKGGLEAEF